MNTKNSSSKVSNWVKRVMATLNLSEEGKVLVFGEYAADKYRKGVKEREKLIRNLTEERDEVVEREEEILTELKADLLVIVDNIDTTKINTRQEREAYFEQYDSNISEHEAAIEVQEEKISAIQDEYNANIDRLNEEITVLNNRLHLLEA